MMMMMMYLAYCLMRDNREQRQQMPVATLACSLATQPHLAARDQVSCCCCCCKLVKYVVEATLLAKLLTTPLVALRNVQEFFVRSSEQLLTMTQIIARGHNDVRDDQRAHLCAQADHNLVCVTTNA